jgi:uncharacterized cupin superfamily protein
MKKVNLNDIPWIERKSPKGQFHKFRRNVARAFDNPKTGPKLPGSPPFEVELVRVAPGAKNFPFHSHAAEWEFYLIVSGAGSMRVGKKKTSLKPGDCVLNPPGEPHQIINTGTVDLLYYVIANNAPTDIWHYPDSNKWGWPSAGGAIFRKSDADYFDGEE